MRKKTFSFEVIEGRARRLQVRPRKLRRPHPDAPVLPGACEKPALGPVGLTSITTSRWNWWSATGCARRSCISITSIPRPCPCSLELSEHARATRNQLATPHSQRSVARISVEVAEGQGCLWFEDLIEMARAAVADRNAGDGQARGRAGLCRTERRQPDLRRGMPPACSPERLHADARVADFRVVASHQESLHSHDAVSVLTEGETFAQASL